MVNFKVIIIVGLGGEDGDRHVTAEEEAAEVEKG